MTSIYVGCYQAKPTHCDILLILPLVLKLLDETMTKNKGKDAVSNYKETIRNYVKEQFDDIIAEAKTELGEETGENSEGKEVDQLKDAMSSVLDNQLDALEGIKFINSVIG